MIFEKSSFRSISNLNFVGYTGSNNQILNKIKIKLVTKDGRFITTFYCYSGLQGSPSSKLSYIFSIHQNVPQIISFEVYDGPIGKNILKL